MAERRKVQVHNNIAVFTKDVYNGTTQANLTIQNGARLVFTAYIFAIDAATTVNVKVGTSFSESMPFCNVLNLQGTAVGHIKGVLSDFHGFLDVDLEVIGGNAEVIVGMSVYDNALTTRIENAEIAVDLNHILQPNGAYDSVRVGDGVEELSINPDGSINVNIVNTSVTPEAVKNIFNKITSIADNIRTSIVSHTAAIGKQTYLQRINVNGNNTACYEVEIGGSIIDEGCTYFGGPLREQFDFDGYSENGLIISPGTKVEVFVEHCRDEVGDFSSRIQILEIG